MNYPLLNAFWTMMLLFIWIAWIFLVVRIVLDIFRSPDLGGWGKAGWLLLVLVLPFLGVLVYLIARGGGMADRDVRNAQAQDEAMRAYIRDAAGGPGSNGADELAKLADLRDKGVISDAEFQRGKEKVLG
jgi:hypothetical protein